MLNIWYLSVLSKLLAVANTDDMTVDIHESLDKTANIWSFGLDSFDEAVPPM